MDQSHFWGLKQHNVSVLCVKMFSLRSKSASHTSALVPNVFWLNDKTLHKQRSWTDAEQFIRGNLLRSFADGYRWKRTPYSVKGLHPFGECFYCDVPGRFGLIDMGVNVG